MGRRIGNVTSRKTRREFGAVDRGGLDELVGHLREARVERDRDEGKGPPDDQKRHHGELRKGRRVPVVLEVVAEVQFGEHVVEDAVLEVRHPEPDLDRDDDGHRPDEHETRREKHAHHRPDADEQQCHQRAEHHRQPDVRDREHDRAQQGVPEDGVVEDRA